MSALFAFESAVLMTEDDPLQAEQPLIDVRHLRVQFGRNCALDDVSFGIGRGKTVALVGESGSGKSTVALSIMGLLPQGADVKTQGSVVFDGGTENQKDLFALSERERRKVRGKDISMIFQDPMSSLNPVYTIQSQICEAIRAHQKCSRGESKSRALDLLTSLGVPNPANCLSSYPHQLSGGMRQRVMIAMALACGPSLLIADEPTTALDATIQAQLLELFKAVQARTGMAILFITHNIGIVAEMADEVMVMYAGQLVEAGPTSSVLQNPKMPYTKALLRSVPVLGRRRQSGDVLEAIPGQVPCVSGQYQGCRFFARCRYAEAGICDLATPPLERVESAHLARCFKWKSVQEAAQ
ncbi:MAG: ABC transporter ATP-binding protein [Pseudomonadota bacterium]